MQEKALWWLTLAWGRSLLFDEVTAVGKLSEDREARYGYSNQPLFWGFGGVPGRLLQAGFDGDGCVKAWRSLHSLIMKQSGNCGTHGSTPKLLVAKQWTMGGEQIVYHLETYGNRFAADLYSSRTADSVKKVIGFRRYPNPIWEDLVSRSVESRLAVGANLVT